MRYLFWMTAATCLAITAMAAEPASQPASQPTSQPTTAPLAINWDQATTHVGETVTVTGPVISIHVSANKKNLSLNVGKDYPDPSRFLVFMPYDTKAASPDELYKGKAISVTGKIILYRKLAEIRADAKDVVVQK